MLMIFFFGFIWGERDFRRFLRFKLFFLFVIICYYFWVRGLGIRVL